MCVFIDIYNLFSQILLQNVYLHEFLVSVVSPQQCEPGRARVHGLCVQIFGLMQGLLFFYSKFFIIY